MVPAGPLLVLEAQDFASLVRDWNSSREKELWLKSANYQVFSRSRLFLRLEEVHGHFAAAAGFPPDMATVEEVAGSESVLALYDIGKLEFLYLTRLPSARAVETALWKKRSDYQPRSVEGLPFYVRVDPESRRVVAFATQGDLLLVATREDLVAGALALSKGRSEGAVKGERWFDQAVRAAGPRGELRLVANLEALGRSPYFRSYWIQRNVSELRPYRALVSDVRRSPEEIREERVLLRSEQAAAPQEAPPASRAALDEALRLVPEEAGLHRAWSAPSVKEVRDLLERKVLAPRPTTPLPTKAAPGVALSGGEVGAEADLEIHIDEAPLANVAGRFLSQPLGKLLEANLPQAVLLLESSRAIPGGAFVGTESVVAVEGSAEWDAEAARSALLEAVASLWSTSRLGLSWAERKKGAHTYYETEGLAPLAMAAQGRWLLVAETAQPLLVALERMSGAAAPQGSAGAVYAAGFRHSRERGPFRKMMILMDHPQIETGRRRAGAEAREPQFFSENIASLSGALARMESVSIVVRDKGAALSQTVVYRMGK